VVVMRTGHLTLVAALSSLLLAASLSAQEAESAADQPVEARSLTDFARPRRMIYFYETEPGSLTAFERFLLYNSILTDVAGASEVVVLVESPDQDVPVTRAGKEELALRVDADSWLNVYVAGGLSDLTVQAQLYDMSAGGQAGEIIVRPGFPVTPRTLTTGFWTDIVQAISEEFEPLITANEMTILGRPGTEVSNLPGGPYVIDESGRLDLLLPTPATYTVAAQLRGFVPVLQAVYLADEPRELDLQQLPTYRFAADLAASSFQFPGARLRYHIVPGSWFLRLGLTTQLAGVNFVPNQPLISLGRSPLSTLYLDGGTLFGELDDFSRILVAFGGFLRVRHFPLDLETDASLGGVHLSAGVELAPWQREAQLRNVRFFAEYQPTYFITGSPQDFLERSFPWNAFPGGNVPLVLPLPYGVLDLRDLYLGVRVTW